MNGDVIGGRESEKSEREDDKCIINIVKFHKVHFWHNGENLNSKCRAVLIVETVGAKC